MKNKLNPVHPGEILKEELRERGLSATALAHSLDLPVHLITSILSKQTQITLETAFLLSQFFHTSPHFWLNLQESWRIRQAENRLNLSRSIDSDL